jgi:hypothetical protein
MVRWIPLLMLGATRARDVARIEEFGTGASLRLDNIAQRLLLAIKPARYQVALGFNLLVLERPPPRAADARIGMVGGGRRSYQPQKRTSKEAA